MIEAPVQFGLLHQNTAQGWKFSQENRQEVEAGTLWIFEDQSLG
jgi:hypothetical protein